VLRLGVTPSVLKVVNPSEVGLYRRIVLLRNVIKILFKFNYI